MPNPSIEESYRRRWLVLAVLCLSILLTVVANMALNVALPTIGRTLHAGASSTVTWELIAARGVMGVGSALIRPGPRSILATVFPSAERPRAIGIWASVAGGSVALSITWSGAMLENFWWGSIFLGMAGIAVVALAGGWLLRPTSRHPEQARLDPPGALLSVIGVTGLLYGFIQAPDDGWTAAPILAAFAAGVVALAASTGAIMSSLPPHQAVVGSTVNDLDRELGGAFGIGVLPASHCRSTAPGSPRPWPAVRRT
jgi:MFS family permease